MPLFLDSGKGKIENQTSRKVFMVKNYLDKIHDHVKLVFEIVSVLKSVMFPIKVSLDYT